ncbi:MAG: hypothetical protein ACOC4K_02885 [Verrucomicrobiota bacterium]
MGTGPVQYAASGKINSQLKVKRVYYVGTTALVRGAVLVYDQQATFAAFTKGPGIDVDLSAGTDSELFAGIVDDSSVGSTGGWIDIIVPQPGDVFWARVASGLDNGDGVTVQAASTDQGFADSAAFTENDVAICLMDEDAADNPFASDNLAPLLWAGGTA